MFYPKKQIPPAELTLSNTFTEAAGVMIPESNQADARKRIPMRLNDHNAV